MARMARFKISEEEAWYHVHSRTAGVKGEYVLSKPLARQRLLDLIEHYSQVYFCDVASVTVMGNHWHGIFGFAEPRDVSDEELRERAGTSKGHRGQVRDTHYNYLCISSDAFQGGNSMLWYE